jgi:16S rRNA (guanine(966)-N(2))-methyltransferase RsmD
VRVIAGTAKGRKLAAVPGEGTRPVTDRVKESLFNILSQDIEGAIFLDLFAGTGGVGIEALSRGAARVVFVDRVRKAIETLRHNLEITRLADRAQVVQGDAFHYLAHADPASFDYVYVAPPQYEDIWAQALLALDERPILAPEGEVIVQIHPKEARDLSLRTLEMYRERRYGSTLLRFYALRSDADEPPDGVQATGSEDTSGEATGGEATGGEATGGEDVTIEPDWAQHDEEQIT